MMMFLVFFIFLKPLRGNGAQIVGNTLKRDDDDVPSLPRCIFFSKSIIKSFAVTPVNQQKSTSNVLNATGLQLL